MEDEDFTGQSRTAFKLTPETLHGCVKCLVFIVRGQIAGKESEKRRASAQYLNKRYDRVEDLAGFLSIPVEMRP